VPVLQATIKKMDKPKKNENGYKWFHITIRLIVKGITIFLNLHFSLVDGEPMTYFCTYHFSFKKNGSTVFHCINLCL